MEEFARNLRARSQELGLSAAEVARRAGLNERRYGHYATGAREPNLETLLKISEVLGTTPNALLGIDVGDSDKKREKAPCERRVLLERLVGAHTALNIDNQRLAVSLIEAVLMHQRKEESD